MYRVVGASNYEAPTTTRPYTSVVLLPEIRLRINNTKKIKNKTLAIPAAPAATPPKPKMAAMMATTKKITVQRNITFNFKLDNDKYKT